MIPGGLLFWLRDTHGVPLSLVIDWAVERGYKVDLPGFYLAAARSSRALAAIREAMIDTGCTSERADACVAWLA